MNTYDIKIVFGLILLGMGMIFLIISVVFRIENEKACRFISRYNCKTKEERRHYDEKRLSRDYARLLLICSLIFILGGIGCFFVSSYFFWGTIILWFIYFFANIGLSDKVFDQYKKIQ